MTKLRGKYARLYIDHMPIYLDAFEMDANLETMFVDGSVYGDDFDEYEIIRAKGQMSVTARMTNTYRDPADSADQLLDKFFLGRMMDLSTGLPATTPAVTTMIIKDTPVAGDTALFTRGYGGLAASMPRDGLSSLRFNLVNTGPIHNGLILYLAEVTLTDASPTVTSAEINLGDATNWLRAAAHVINFTENDPTITDVTVKIQSDLTGFASPTDRITFPAFTDEGESWQELLVDYGVAAEDFHRIVITATGSGTPWSVTFSLLVVAKTG